MDFTWLYNLWNTNLNALWWQVLLIGLFFLGANFGLFVILGYMRREVIISFGYPKRKKKFMKKKLATFSSFDRIFLIKLTLEAERKSGILYISLVCHFISMLAFFVCCIGFIGFIFTVGAGWALTLLLLSSVWPLFITLPLEIIAHFIWNPSERRRWKL